MTRNMTAFLKIKYVIFFLLLTSFCRAGGIAPGINLNLLKKNEGKCELFEGTVFSVKKSYLLNGREYKIIDDQMKALQLDAFEAADPLASTYMKIRVLHTVTLRVDVAFQGSLKKMEKVEFEVLDHIDSMCPHFRTLPLHTANGTPASLVWMFYYKEGEKGILRREHALESKEDWKALSIKGNQNDGE
jgi:hypothetical protein